MNEKVVAKETNWKALLLAGASDGICGDKPMLPENDGLTDASAMKLSNLVSVMKGREPRRITQPNEGGAFQMNKRKTRR